MMLRSVALALLVACSSSSGPSTTARTPVEPPPVAQKDAPGMGEKCGDGDACGAGLTCVSYYGIAGASGPQFKSCEIRCKDDAQCPKDHKCQTIADGPGQVCR